MTSSVKNKLIILVTPVIFLLACLFTLANGQFFPAALIGAYGLYFAITRSIPFSINEWLAAATKRRSYNEVIDLGRFGLKWCKFFKIGALPNLDRSIAWDNLIRSHLASALMQQGKFQEAVAVHREHLEIVDAGGDVDGTAKVSAQLAFCLLFLNQLDEANRLLDRALPILESAHRNAKANDKTFAVHAPRYLLALFHKATLLETRRDFVRATEVRRRSVAVCKELYKSDDDIRMMPHLSMLGRDLIRLGEFDEAEKSLNLVLAVRTKALQPGDIQITTTKGGLGRLYCAMGKLEESEPLLMQALAGLQKDPKVEHPDLPSMKDDLAKLRRKQGRYADAEQLLLAAIEQKERQSSKDHPDLIEYLLDLSELKLLMGDSESAEQAKARADRLLSALH